MNIQIHHHRSVNPVARGCAHQDREHRELCGSCPQPLGGKVWHSRRNHIRQRHPFHIKPVDGPVSAAGHRGAANDNVQPRSQRHGRAAPQDLESSTHDKVRYRQLGDQPAVGTAGPPNDAKRGDQRHRRRDDLLQQHTSAWRFLRLPWEELSTRYMPRSKKNMCRANRPTKVTEKSMCHLIYRNRAMCSSE